MAIFYQHNINPSTKLAVWYITEDENFFLERVSLQREITHPHKRLQHLAGKFLLQHLFPDFPYDLIKIADTRKPFLVNEEYHFSISHCGNYAAVIVSKDHRVGIDIELFSPKVENIKHKFLNTVELTWLKNTGLQSLTTLWSAKEAVFKWYGGGDVDFREHICFDSMEDTTVKGHFLKGGIIPFEVHHQRLDDIMLAYLCTPIV